MIKLFSCDHAPIWRVYCVSVIFLWQIYRFAHFMTVAKSVLNLILLKPVFSWLRRVLGPECRYAGFSRNLFPPDDKVRYCTELQINKTFDGTENRRDRLRLREQKVKAPFGPLKSRVHDRTGVRGHFETSHASTAIHETPLRVTPFHIVGLEASHILFLSSKIWCIYFHPSWFTRQGNGTK
jgi:hypothetical protein